MLPTWRAVSKPNVGISRGEWQVVVDGFGDVADTDAASGLLRHLARRKHRIITADGRHAIYTEGVQSIDDSLQILGTLGRVGSRGVENRAALKMDARNVVVIELYNLTRITLHEPLKSVIYADHSAPPISCLECYRTDHTVDSRRGPTPDQDG